MATNQSTHAVFQPITDWTKTNHDLGYARFPALGTGCTVCFEVWSYAYFRAWRSERLMLVTWILLHSDWLILCLCLLWNESSVENCSNPQNRRDFFAYFRRTEAKARRYFFRALPLARDSRFALASVRLKYAKKQQNKNHACSAGYIYVTVLLRTRRPQLKARWFLELTSPYIEIFMNNYYIR